MYKKITAVLLTVVLLLGLCACGLEEKPPRQDSAPGRMVQRIEVAIHPADPRFDRSYVTQENMNALLGLLRGMETQDYPETEPDPADGQTLYTVTVTFAGGEQSVYRLLGHTYLQLGDDPWCIIGPASSMTFSNFIREHPSDDGAVPVETADAPTEAGE